MNYLSMCSGIEAASVAWEWLGWKPIGFAEIERYPSAVLAYHYPSVPNYGDMRGIANRILLREIEAPDVIVAGTPCQSYSIAGNRGSLNDERGQLTLSFVQCAAAVDTIRARDGKPACVITWENVPGVLSTHDNAFGCFLAGLAGEDVALLPPGKRWPDAGCVYGPKRAVAWRVLDAQYFGLAQRRKRVFVVASARAGFDPAEVLFEWQGVRRDSPPSRGARENIAGTIAGGARRRGGYSHDDTPSVAHCLNAGGMGRQDSESESMIIATSTGRGWWDKNDIAASMRAQDSANKADTLIAHPLRAQHNASLRADSDTYVAFNHNAQACQLPGESRDTSVVDALTCSQGAAVAFTCKDYGADAGEISPTLRAMGHAGSHANAGGQVAVCVTGDLSHSLKAEGADASEDGTGRGNPIVAVAFQSSQSGVRSDDVHATLDSNNGSRRHNGAVTQQGVRRLTVRECERLMGFPDDYTLIPYGHVSQKKLDEDWIKYLMRGGKVSREVAQAAAADGPRYKALGNSKAVPIVRWIGQRIQMVIDRLEASA